MTEQEKQDFRDRINKNNNKTKINQDYIVRIKPDEDIITAVDKEENEIHRLCFDVDGHNVYFTSPRLFNFKKFKLRFAELLMILARYAGNLELPNDKISFIKDPTSDTITHKLLSIAIGASDKIKNLILEIFFDYLDGNIEGIELSEHAIKYPKKVSKKGDLERFQYFLNQNANHQREWFQVHAKEDDMIRVFTACFCTDDFSKKKSEWILKTVFNPHSSEELPSENTSASNLVLIPPNGKATPAYSFDL